MCFSLNSATIFQYLIFLTCGSGCFSQFLIHAAFRCPEGSFVVYRSLPWVYIECISCLCDLPTPHVIICPDFLLQPLQSLTFPKSATENATCLLRDVHTQSVMMIFFFFFLWGKAFTVLCNTILLYLGESAYSKSQLFSSVDNLGLSVNIAQPFLNRALLSLRSPQEDVIRV